MVSNSAVFRLALVTGALIIARPSPAEGQIPEKFTNLQMLHKETTRADLVAVMRQFSMALDVRCDHCHVGEDASTLKGFDFASDDKEPKRVARRMMKMVRDINQNHLASLGRAQTLEVKCSTCHGGVQRPQSLRDLLLATVESDGVQTAVKQYRELREEHYGDGAYDFSPGTLNSVTEALGRGKRDFDSAAATIRLNLEFYPDSHSSHFLLSLILAAKKDRQGALASLERALELSPGNRSYSRQLDRLKQQK